MHGLLARPDRLVEQPPTGVLSRGGAGPLRISPRQSAEPSGVPQRTCSVPDRPSPQLDRLLVALFLPEKRKKADQGVGCGPGGPPHKPLPTSRTTRESL